MGFIICWYSRPCSSTFPPLVSGLTYPCDPGSLMVTAWCASLPLNLSATEQTHSHADHMVDSCILWRVLWGPVLCMQNGILIPYKQHPRHAWQRLYFSHAHLISFLLWRDVSRLVSHLWPTFSIYSPSSHDNCPTSFGRLAFWLALSQIRLAAEIGRGDGEWAGETNRANYGRHPVYGREPAEKILQRHSIQ